MKGLLRPLLVGGLSIAIAGVGLSGGRAAAAGNAAPTSVAVVPSATTVFEGDLLNLTVTLDSAASEQIRVEVNWGEPSPSVNTVLLNPGDKQVEFGHTYMDDMPGTMSDQMTVTVTAANATTSLSASVSVLVKNAPPTITSLTVSPSAINTGQDATVTGTFEDAGKADRHNVMVDWGDGETGFFPKLLAKTYTFSYTHTYPVAGTYTITPRVIDDDSGWVEEPVQLTVGSTNVSPSNFVLAMSAVAEGGTSTLTATFTDPDAADTHAVNVSWGDGSGIDTLPTLAAGIASFTPAHTYAATGTYTVTVVLNDSAGHSITAMTAVSVSNVGPSVSLTVPSSPVAGDSLDLSGTITDPGTTDTFTLSVDWGVVTATATPPVLGADGRSFTASHAYTLEGSYPVVVTVTDRDGATGTVSATVVVRHRNVPPTSLTLGAPAVVQGAMTTVTGSFSDTDAPDGHSVVMSWGDGTPSSTWSLAPGVTSFTATHGYASAGTWMVSATATDSAGASASATTLVVVTAPATTTAALLDQLTDLVKSFDLDRSTQRWLIRRLDELKSSVAGSSAEFCDALRGLDRLASIGRRTLTSEQLAAVSDLTAKLQASATCSATGDEEGQHENATPTAPEKPTTPAAPKPAAPKEDANRKDQNDNKEKNGQNKNSGATTDKGNQNNTDGANSTKGARNSRANN
ncbi:MAG: PKD domain-containing protein [Chloroflexota bacterium]|nr:PKD domain-containing protein [Chloroflexota bacterium]